MKRWFGKSLVLSMIALFVLALVPAASAEDEQGTIFGGGEWVYACGETSVGGIPAGVARIDLQDRIPPEFSIVEYVYIYSAEFGVLAEYTDEWSYDEFSTFVGYWNLPVPIDGYALIVDKVYDNGGGLMSVSTARADCTTGEITIGQSSIYGPKVPSGFVLQSLWCSSAVLDEPGGKQVEDNAVYAGQSWFVNPTPKAGPDGKNYTEIFVGGWTTGYIPTECVAGLPVVSAE